jgi:Spx/MgsR family transcriptional regulator
MTITLYGIPNCDTVKKARAFLAERGVACSFHDYKKLGVPPADLASWTERVGWERLLNRRGTMWRKLSPAVQAEVHDAASAMALMLAQPSVIKRPVVVHGAELLVGFDPSSWSRIFV